MRNKINDGVEALARKSQAGFQIFQGSSLTELLLRLKKSENLPEISLSRPHHHGVQRKIISVDNFFFFFFSLLFFSLLLLFVT